MSDAIERLAAWAASHGKDLCPPPGKADTYGEGMRAAKAEVRHRLHAVTKELDRIRAVIRATHDRYCDVVYTDRGMHAPGCLLYEIEGG